MNDLGFLGRGWSLSLPRNRHDESWRGGMTLPSFLEKSGFTGVNCRFRGISGRRVCVSCSIFFQLLRGNDWCRAQSFIEQKASGDCLCWSRAVFYRAKASVIIKLGLRCSLWFALDEWNLRSSLRCSHFCWRNVWVVMGLCTFSHSPWRHICDVISSFVPYCQSNCKLSSLVAKSCEWSFVIGWKLLLWMFSLKLDTTTPRCLF